MKTRVTSASCLRLACENDVAIIFPRDIDKWSNCSHINGSLTIEDLDPTDCNQTNLPSLSRLRNVTGYVWIRNLYNGYQNFSDLLPNLTHIGGRKKIPQKRGNGTYTFLITGSSKLAPPNWNITLENGCTNISSVVFQGRNGTTCDKCGDGGEGFYCPPSTCEGTFVISSLNDLKAVHGCREIDGGVVFSVPHHDEEDSRRFRASLGEIERIRDYLVVANTDDLEDLSFFGNLKSIGDGNSSRLWDKE